MSLEDLPYRPSVGVALFNRDGKVFLGRRKRRRAPSKEGLGFEWQMPQGGIDRGETPRAAALRELYEETNVESVSLLAEAPQWLSYDLPPDVAANRWRGRFRGQRQKWFAFRFEGQDSEIDIDRPAKGAHPPEFDAWRWERIEELPALVIPFKRQVYEAVVESFAALGKPAES
jgi:putative (di)nucleoside polyphosphate hydrolase